MNNTGLKVREYFRTPLIDFNIVVGGLGIPLPSIIEIYGEKDSGKSTIAQHFPVWFLDNFKDGIVCYIDSEQKIDEKRFVSFLVKHGYRIENIDVFADNDLDSIFDFIQGKLVQAQKEKRKCLVVWDSVADVTTKEDKKGYSEAKITAKFTSLFPMVSRNVYALNSCMVLVNQVRRNLANPSGGYISKRGEYLKHKVNIKIKVDAEPVKRQYGDFVIKDARFVKVRTEKNHLFIPDLTTCLYIDSEGIDIVTTLHEVVKIKGIVKTAGAWKIFNFAGFNVKWRTLNEFKELVREKAELIDMFKWLLMKQVSNSSLIKVKLIDELWEIEERLGLEKTQLTPAEQKLYDEIQRLKSNN